MTLTLLTIWLKLLACKDVYQNPYFLLIRSMREKTLPLNFSPLTILGIFPTCVVRISEFFSTSWALGHGSITSEFAITILEILGFLDTEGHIKVSFAEKNNFSQSFTTCMVTTYLILPFKFDGRMKTGKLMSSV